MINGIEIYFINDAKTHLFIHLRIYIRICLGVFQTLQSSSFFIVYFFFNNTIVILSEGGGFKPSFFAYMRSDILSKKFLAFFIVS